MHIDEAIQKSAEARAFLLIHHQDKLAEAVSLGAEALKRCRVIKQESVLKPFALLPGETEEDIPRNIGKLPSDEENK